MLGEALLAAGLCEAVTATVIFLAVWRRIASSCTVAVALSAGYATGHALVAGWPSLPPRDATQWLFCFAVLAFIVALADAFIRSRRNLRIALWTIICSAASGLLLRPMFQHSWGRVEGWLYLLCIVIWLVLLTWSLEVIESRPSGLSTLLWFATVVSAGTCAALMLSGSLLLGELAFVFTGAAGISFLLVRLFPVQTRPIGAAVPLVLLLGGLWLSGHFYAELPLSSLLLLAVAPALGLFAVQRGERWHWKAFLLQSALVGAPVILAVVVAYHASPPLDY